MNFRSLAFTRSDGALQFSERSVADFLDSEVNYKTVDKGSFDFIAQFFGFRSAGEGPQRHAVVLLSVNLSGFHNDFAVVGFLNSLGVANYVVQFAKTSDLYRKPVGLFGYGSEGKEFSGGFLLSCCRKPLLTVFVRIRYDLDKHVGNAILHKPQFIRSGSAQVNVPAFYEWTAVVDAHDNLPIVGFVGDAHPGVERQAEVRGGHGGVGEFFAVGGFSALKFFVVKGSDSVFGIWGFLLGLELRRNTGKNKYQEELHQMGCIHALIVFNTVILIL